MKPDPNADEFTEYDLPGTPPPGWLYIVSVAAVFLAVALLFIFA